MKRILLVGNVVLDLIHEVDHFPREDEEMRARSRTAQLGGNAANSAVLLAAEAGGTPAGPDVALAATLADDAEGRQLAGLLTDAGVHGDHLVFLPGATPMSCILTSPGGHRTIVHYRDLPELAVDDLERDYALTCDWLHFEGRNVDALAVWLPALREAGYTGRISLEAEKPRPGLEALFGHVDVLMVARPYAEARGFDQAAACLDALAFAGFSTCTWGAAGAWGRVGGRTFHQPPEAVEVRHGVGAGDAFNAGLIAALATGEAPEAALAQASRWAARRLSGDG